MLRVIREIADSDGWRAAERVLIVLLVVIVSMAGYIGKEKSALLDKVDLGVTQIQQDLNDKELRLSNIERSFLKLMDDRAVNTRLYQAWQLDVSRQLGQMTSSVQLLQTTNTSLVERVDRVLERNH
jgi:hypothetical protein